MPNKFPHLKSTTEPIGPVEQLGMAITLNHEEDPSGDPDNSWFGRMFTDDAVGYFEKEPGTLKFFQAPKSVLTNAYYKKNGDDLLFTAHDWKCDFLRIEDTSQGIGILEGRVVIKGHCNLGAFSIDPAKYEYIVYEIVRNQNTKDRWKIKRWVLFSQKPGQWGPVDLNAMLSSS